MKPDIQEIKDRESKATPGPWKWYVNEHCKSIRLVTNHSGQYYVMGFERWGMQGAQPIFQVYERYDGDVRDRGSKGMRKAIELSKWNQAYRHDDGWIEHPDAELIAHAPEDIRALLAYVTELETALEAAKKDIRRIALTCKHGGDCDYISAVTGRPDCMGCTDWEWRGVSEDNK